MAQAVGEALPGRFDVLSLPFRAAEAAGFLALVGLLVDRLTLREANQGWAQLRERYDAGQWQVRLRYVAVVLPVVLLLSQQLISGSARQTITSVVLAAQTVPTQSGPGAGR